MKIMADMRTVVYLILLKMVWSKPSLGFPVTAGRSPLSSCDVPKLLIATATAATAKLLQSCSTLCDPIDGSPPGSPVPGILQARTLEWVATSFSNGWKWKVKVKSLSRVRLLATTWTAAHQAPLSMGFSRQEYWSGLPLPSLMDCTVHWILQARILEWVAFLFSKGSSQSRDGTQVSRVAGGFFTIWATRKAQQYWSG